MTSMTHLHVPTMGVGTVAGLSVMSNAGLKAPAWIDVCIVQIERVARAARDRASASAFLASIIAMVSVRSNMGEQLPPRNDVGAIHF